MAPMVQADSGRSTRFSAESRLVSLAWRLMRTECLPGAMELQVSVTAPARVLPEQSSLLWWRLYAMPGGLNRSRLFVTK
eukprot:5650006-Pyramimonas_sp.AAC.1